MTSSHIPIEPGTKFNKLTVIQKVKVSNSTAAHYLCRCECGGEKIVKAYALKKNTTKSCGCIWARRDTPLGKARLKTPEEYAWTLKYCNYRNQAKKKQREFEITEELFREICQLNCWYCGDPPELRTVQVTMGPQHKGKASIITHGIDRKDSSGGYTLDNIIPCCQYCNRAKQDSPYDNFITMCNKIALNHPLAFGISTRPDIKD